MSNELGLHRKSPLVLVVDDDPLLRLLMRAALEQADFAVDEAGNGVACISAFERLRPDVVLLDVMMPEMDGFSACEQIRKLPGGELTPILMVTGLDDMDSINRAYEVGATDFIAKPVNWRVLGHHVKYMLRASRAFSQLKQSEAKNRALLNAIPDLMFRISQDGVFLEAKGAKEVKTLPAPQGFVGRRLEEMLPRGIAQKAMYHLRRALETQEMQFFEYELSLEEGKRWYEARIVVSGEEEVLAIVRDMTDRKRAEEQIVRLAYYDGLTGLPNRLMLQERLEQAIRNAKRSKKKVAVMFLDLDHFKDINDTLGHHSGDLLLQKVGDRLLTCTRSTDTVARIGGDERMPTVARMGGDEFIILLAEITTIQHIALIAQRILHALSQPFTIGSHEIFTTPSIGITVYPLDSTDSETLLKYADTAMYQAKEKGRNNFQFYTASMHGAAVERFTIETQLRKALARDEFQLYYQAALDSRTRRICGVEALVRWRHPERGLVTPLSFIPLAEETGLIVPIGDWIMHSACAQNRTWQQAGFPPIRVMLNISGVQLRQSNFVEHVMQVLTEVGLEPQHLELELTESIIMEHAETAITTLKALREKGIQLSIDDFGTGYSSLSYLKKFPVHTLKIDRSFIQDLDKDPESAAIVKSIVSLAHNLNLRVVAEGVETEEQMAFLQECGCDHLQGFLIHVPGPAETLTQIWQEGILLNLGRVSS
ncbi:MAG: EAL domain-containing protein [candidate division NC10 bacterium]|nr:EAL domain-containing protein [candidate division NC10 bacterium]